MITNKSRKRGRPRKNAVKAEPEPVRELREFRIVREFINKDWYGADDGSGNVAKIRVPKRYQKNVMGKTIKAAKIEGAEPNTYEFTP